MLRRIGVLASLAVMATMFAGVQSASAQTAGVCVFEGLAGTLTPAIPNALADLSLDVEQGEYVYTGNTAVCAGVFDGAPQVATNVSINSEGYYDNLLCGTGTAHDADGDKTTVSGNGIDVTGAGYQIPFIGGVGPLLIGPSGAPNIGGLLPGGGAHSDATDPDPQDMAHAPVSGDYTGLGVVQITPGQGLPTPDRDNCITPAGIPPGGDGDTDSFEVKGFFVAANL